MNSLAFLFKAYFAGAEFRTGMSFALD